MSSNSMYEVKDVKKGQVVMQGMFASKDIDVGDVILKDSSFFEAGLKIDEKGAKAILDKVKALSNEDQLRYEALTCCEETAVLKGIAAKLGPRAIEDPKKMDAKIVARFETNAMQDKHGHYRYIAGEAARMNHSCKPNATYDYFQSTGTVIVRALERIAKGKEILIAYVRPLMEGSERKKLLKKDYGFECKCDICVGRALLVKDDKKGVVHQELISIENKLTAIRSEGYAQGYEKDGYQTDKQMKHCIEFVNLSKDITAILPDTLHWLDVYLHILEESNRLGTSEAKKWFPEGAKISKIVRGPDDKLTKKYMSFS